MNRAEQIKHHEAEADRLQGEADAHRWEAARLIAEELAGGKSQRQLAGEIGKDQAHVSRMAKVWREHGSDDHGHQSFDSLYQAAKRGKAKPEPEPDGGSLKDFLERSRPGAGELPQPDPEGLAEALARLKDNQGSTEKPKFDFVRLHASTVTGFLSLLLDVLNNDNLDDFDREHAHRSLETIENLLTQCKEKLDERS